MREKSKKEKLKKAGWAVGNAADFLDLSDQEAALIELKLALARDLRQRRRSRKLTQTQFARLLRSSQSRVAKMEAGDPTVSIDLLLRSLFSLGASPKQLAKVLASVTLS
jgi:DNA-binding transcriptional regulator YiaG